jgi:hypothetical protein
MGESLSEGLGEPLNQGLIAPMIEVTNEVANGTAI